MASFDPQALTSLTLFMAFRQHINASFRSTGSYEPDLGYLISYLRANGFDPQALTSLTLDLVHSHSASGSFDPQALTSLTC